MEFLIAKGFSDTNQNDLKNNLEKSVTFSDEKETIVHTNDHFYLFAHGTPIKISANELFLFDGHVFHQNAFLHTSLGIDAADIAPVFHALETKAMNDVSGVFTLASVDLSSQQFKLYCDPLSQYPIASWESGDKYIVSNNVFLIEQFLHFYGHSLTRDPLCMLRNAIAVVNVSMTTPFKEVSFQPPRNVLIGGEKLAREELFTWDYLCNPTVSYSECIETAANRLKSKCDALIKAMPDHYFVSDLTGGMDSRLVLAALIAAGHEKKVDYWCNNRYPHPDGNVADHIIDKYNLNQGISLINKVNEDFTLGESIKRGLFRNRGARYKDWSGLGKGYFPKLVRMNGCFGEIGRSNVYTHVFNNPELDLNNFSRELSQHLDKLGNADVLTPEGKKRIVDPIHQTVIQMKDMGISRDYMSDMLYIDGRGRYHFGHYFSVITNLFISPCLIYDLNIVWANTHLNNEQKASGKVQFDLIRKLAGDELAIVPLADKTWSLSIIPKEMKKKFKSIKSITRHSEKLSNKENTMNWKLGWPIDPDKRIKPKPCPPFAKGRSIAWAQLPEYQALVRELLDKMNGNELIFQYIDKQRLQLLAEQEPEEFEKDWHVWSLQAIVGGLMWELGLEDRTPISTKYKGEYPIKKIAKLI